MLSFRIKSKGILSVNPSYVEFSIIGVGGIYDCNFGQARICLGVKFMY